MEGFFSFLPVALLFLLCPLMMLFMHRGGAHDGHAEGDHAQHHQVQDRAEIARRLAASKEDAKT